MNNIPLEENYPNPDELSQIVLQHLKIYIEQEFPIGEEHDVIDRQAQDHKAYAEFHRRTYIGRDGYFETFDHHAGSDSGPLVLLGESGSGKSALLANWLDHWNTMHVQDFIFQHYIGGTPDSSEHWHLMTRLILSTLECDTLDSLKPRGWQTVRVAPLTDHECREVIAKYLARFGKRLDDRWAELISSKSAASSPLYLKILLDELRVTGTHERIGQRLNEYLGATDVPAVLHIVFARYQRDYERDHPGLVGETLGLIWASRAGVTENDLLHLLRPAQP